MKLREAREAAGLSKAEVARAMQVAFAAVLKWESGAAMPRAEKLPQLADLYGCSIDALYGRDPPEAAS